MVTATNPEETLINSIEPHGDQISLPTLYTSFYCSALKIQFVVSIDIVHAMTFIVLLQSCCQCKYDLGLTTAMHLIAD